MSRILTVAGTSFYVVGMLGLVAIAALLLVGQVSRIMDSNSVRAPEAVSVGQPPATLSGDLDRSGRTEAEDTDEDAAGGERPLVAGATSPAVVPTITKLRMPRIQIDTDVVEAPYVDRNGGTWEVPPFKAAHAQFTPGVGEIGNTVIFGHLTSLTLGNVFEHLDRAQVGDMVQVYSGDQVYEYKVSQVRRVPRTELSILDPTDNASVSLITCAGIWLPLASDYTERLLVRAELVNQPTA